MSETEILAHALKLATEAERTAYLNDACAGNPHLRTSVEALLRGGWRRFRTARRLSGRNHGLANGPGSGRHIDTGRRNEGIGTVIAGRYKLLEEIGEGGMGTVWMAQQTEPVKRLVAVKLIKAGMDSKQVLARFEAERQALALMDHPNIAKVLDGGDRPARPAGRSSSWNSSRACRSPSTATSTT